MARKNLLEGLMAEGAKPAELSPASKRPLKGAIGAVSQSIEALKARALLDIDPFLIDAGGLADRLETDDAEDAGLLASIRDYGQQVPVLVRPHPTDPARYQIVYGRRRVLALRDLGQPVKALLRDLDDSALVMAQGQENNARRGLSFIEKANFAAQMRDAGYERRAMCDALAIDKTVVSRMLQIVDRVGPDLITAIGAAPAVGRDRWSALANLLESGDLDTETMRDMIAIQARPDNDSNDRFEIALNAGDPRGAAVRATDHTDTDAVPRPRAHSRTITSPGTGIAIAQVKSGSDKVVLTLPRDTGGGFEDWLVDHLHDIHRTWMKSRSDENPEQQ